MLRSYRELHVWQKAVDLAVESYRFSGVFPKTEIYGLTAQIRRAAVSVAANIAEGYGRGSRKEYLQFLTTAQGSLNEVETHAIIAERLSYATRAQREQLLSQTDQIGRMLGSLIRKLRVSV